ncbi:hypothetical protein CDD80_7544 [Ophiocordyceps camponoti-rufipedis]|uniref:SEC7 domain-containing protein n=1 Tax=Ophiocordyceps camponoti-rufipedis TaxID=2004952 RepID=A0A2C5ZDM8_9HYPO|nr:hypothetical protein CDD80_7544 [Ophiocordyceps camponoti-rufipedis]
MAEHPLSSTAAPNRDSHDLSLSPRAVTRDSLVANMLLSLDQLSLADYHSHVWSDARSRQVRADDDDDDDDDDDQDDQDDDDDRGYDNPRNHGRSRRLAPLDGSPRAPNRGPVATSVSSPSAVFAPPPTLPSRSAVRRSASFDQWPSSKVLRQLADAETPRHGLSDAPARRASDADVCDRVDDDEHDDDAAPEAAPTLSVTRRDATVADPRFPPLPPEPPSPARKRAASRAAKKSPSRSRRSTGRRSTPASPRAGVEFDLDSAPAPSVGYRKPRDRDADAAVAAAYMVPRERPGFFRRVFGSSRNNLAAAAGTSYDRSSPVSPPEGPARPSTSEVQRPQTPQQQQQQQQPKAAPRHHQSSSSITGQRQPNLHKKSSFFRRRKKFASDEAHAPPNPNRTPPPVPALDTVRLPSADQNKSPTSSLRVVMDPYLAGPAGSGLGLSNVQTASPLADITNVAGEHKAAASQKRGFSPDYEPSPMARIRPVYADEEAGVSRAQQQDTPSVRTPSVRTPQRPRRTDSDVGVDGSFLDLDGGGSDDEPANHGFKERRRQRREQRRKKSKESGSKTPRRDDADGDATIRAHRGPPSVSMSASRRRGASESSVVNDLYKMAPNAPPPGLRVDVTPDEPGSRTLTLAVKTAGTLEPLDEPDFVVGEPNEDDRQKARNIYDGCHVFIQKEKAASWMGEEGPVRQRTLQAYMELHDFRDKAILSAMRDVCGRLVLRAETQQVDRILVAFSKRWCRCNPRHGFKATDVVHTICYSIMLLNTDLHLADIDQKMTRSQFVKNTMTTIMQAVTESAPTAFGRPTILPDKDDGGRELLGDNERVSRRTSFLNRGETTDTGVVDDCGPLVKAPFSGPLKAWQEQVETVLKSIYASIRDQRLPLFGAEPERSHQMGPPPQQHGLSVMGMLKRTPSVLSRAPSETQLSSRGRVAESSRTSGSRWTSKSRSRPGVGRNGFSSSRTSFDDGNSMWSPAMSSATWSRYSLGRTHGSMSQDSFASCLPRPDYQQSIGFANALSQAIVREDEADNATSVRSADATALLEDDTLELAGPPWIKEGMVAHKRHMDGVGKRARDRNWVEVFAVIQKGQMGLFSFAAGSKSARQRARARNPAKPVGGGNWQDSAVSLGSFSLRQTLATALPPPGYSRTRPHVWALSLPSGAVHLFQAGSAETVREFIMTANYWSARLSSHPLVGGISNVEYGWGDSMIQMTRANKDEMKDDGGGSAGQRRMSSAASFRRASVDQGSLTSPPATATSMATTATTPAAAPAHGSGGRAGKRAGDRAYIAEWTPPAQSMRPCRAPEDEQLETLVAARGAAEARGVC